MLAFVSGEAKYFLSPEESSKLKAQGRDVASLIEYARSQNERLQMLLDAALGLTNIEQNNIFRLLTVVSVVGIPPTLVASMYGMNFKNIPELDWAYGYQASGWDPVQRAHSRALVQAARLVVNGRKSFSKKT